MEDQSIEIELKIEDDYRKSNKNHNIGKIFYPLNQETNFRLISFLEKLQKEKKNLKY